ncbi:MULTISPECIES: hypothetical protein [Paenibacillus]|uniref:Uncharacterized protein n=1 Tax=Paenibacillus vini TaxID=1476024 RepID=A0ABQ4M9M7_9BACL|nr:MULTISPECIES: hypothetical protein [Paenibacillus]MBQ4899729.1 hypothetical protein [Paenibacillus sp. Marseille-P2973]MDN4068921.1 hypothetical protein [Paenibacillus vini]GIP52693.1 hypothetical protein J42TS3_17280 [Paenibacillus vini]
MNIKRIVIVGTMACVITVIPGISGHTSSKAYAAAFPAMLSHLDKSRETGKDRFIESLGLTNERVLYDSLLEGQSLADIAESNEKEIDTVIQLQTEQLQQQLTQRFASGQLSETAYRLQMEETPEIIKESVYQSYRILG